MPRTPRGTSVPVPAGRRVVAEFLRQSRAVPLVSIRREFALPGLAAVRAASSPRVSWAALFAKAYALAARRHPALRRSWTTFPFGRIYEHPDSACVVLVEREWEGEDVILGGKIRGPEDASLADLDRHIQKFQTAPVMTVSEFRQTLRLGRCPGLLRRFLMWSSLHWSGHTRSKRFGTFLVSSLGNFGCEAGDLKAPLTGYLNYGPIDADGRVTVSLTFDHRVLDGRQAARALVDMESFMNTVLVAEIRNAAGRRAAATAEADWPAAETDRVAA